jgi:hypothetical protein
MTENADLGPLSILPGGTQVVIRESAGGQGGGRSGAVGVVVRAPGDPRHAYRVRLADGEIVRIRLETQSES